MPLVFRNFGGIIPIAEAEKLPDHNAQIAQNVDLRNGTLKGLSVSGLASMNDGSNLTAEIPVAEWFSIPAPSAPSVGRSYMITDSQIVSVVATLFIRHIDPTTHEMTSTTEANTMTVEEVTHTDTGLKVRCSFSGDATFTKEYTKFINYEVRGPRFRIQLNDGTGTVYLPNSATSPESSILPAGIAPMYYDLGGGAEQIGALQCVDYEGPNWDADVYETNGDTRTVTYNKTDVTFTLDANYSDNKRRFARYVISAIKTGGSEGPPSPMSRIYMFKPGQYAAWINTVGAGYSIRHYRSTGGQGYGSFGKVGDYGSGSVKDYLTTPTGDPIPPYGNYPHADARTNSLKMPTNYGVCFYGEYVYFSDLYRMWVWPAEWAIRFPTSVTAIARLGHSIVCWTAASSPDPARVYLITGSSPDGMVATCLSETEALQNKLSICRLDQTIFYASENGLIAVSGGSLYNATTGFYTREQWQALTPSSFVASVQEKAIYLNGSGTDLRFDMRDPKNPVLTTYTALTGGTWTWRSKKIRGMKPEEWGAVRIRANGSVTVKLYADGDATEVVTKGVTTASPVVQLPMVNRRAQTWEVEFIGTNAVVMTEAAFGKTVAEIP